MISKQQTLLLSLESVISSFLIAGTTFFLLVTDTDVNLITHPCSALKIISLVAVISFVLKFMTSFHNDSTFLQEKPKVQILTLFKCAIVLITASFLFHCTAVLFGAPVYSSVPETFHFAVLLTVFTALPCLAVAGLKVDRLADIFTAQREPGMETIVYLTTLGALLGGWLGAIPIPLDWDRPWQAWPISCSIGSISGYSLGLFVASLYLPHEYKAAVKYKSG